MENSELIEAFLALSKAEKIATGVSVAALLLSVLSIWFSRADRRTQLKLMAISAASEAISSATETIDMIENTKPTIDAVFSIASLADSSLRLKDRERLDEYLKYAEKVRALGNSEFDKMTGFLPRFQLAKRAATLTKMKHDSIAAQNTIARIRSEYMTQLLELQSKAR